MILTEKKLAEIKHGDLYRTILLDENGRKLVGFMCRYAASDSGFVFLWKKKDETFTIGSWGVSAGDRAISADISGVDVDRGWYFSSHTERGYEFHIASEPYRTEISTISTLYRIYKNASMDKTPEQKEASVEITLITKRKLIKVNQQF